VARMERIIHDLLDFIRPPKMLRQALVADDIIAQATQKYRLRAEEAEIDLVLDLQADGLVAEMHPGEIQQVMQNFLVNAFQALEGPGRVEVRSRGVEGGIWVGVLDDGPGFDPESVAKLHTPFFSTKPTGSGLGLTICAQIIKAHGGVIEARNRTEGGAEFSFILPRHKPSV
jgi:two-component system sensor histidine kinase HydH